MLAIVSNCELVGVAPTKQSNDKTPIYSNGPPARTKGALQVLFGLLTEIDSIELLLSEGFTAALIPRSELRPIYEWAMHQYRLSGNLCAPTVDMFKYTACPGYGGRSMAEVLLENGINITDVPSEPVSWVIEELRARKHTNELGERAKQILEAVTRAPAADRDGMISDWVMELNEWTEGFGGGTVRKLRLTPLSDIPILATHWLWEEQPTEGRIPLAALSLLSGREGLGKSQIALMLAARITRGTLPGHHFGHPRSVVVAASEDSFSRTIRPRFEAAGGDVSKVYRVEVQADGDVEEIDLPADLRALEKLIGDNDVAVVILDPLTSRLEECLDTHKDADLRKALEKIVRVAEHTETAVIGIIHVNKSGSKDAGNLIMGSRAFSAVPRANIMAIAHDSEVGMFILSQAKNNWGRMDLDALTYRIEGDRVGQDANGEDVSSSHVVMVGTDERFITDILEAVAKGPKQESPRELAEVWLTTHLVSHGGSALASDVKSAAEERGISQATLRRAKDDLGIEVERLPDVYPPQYEWKLPKDAG